MSEAATPLVKICGVRDAAAARAAIEAGADMIGMVFADARRRVDPGAAREIRALLGRRIEIVESSAEAVSDARRVASRPLLVGVFARQRADEINRVLDDVDLDIVQLSGGEDAALAGRIPRPVIRAVHVRPETAPQALLEEAARQPAAVAMLDAYSRQGGGTGAAFDWEKARAVAAVRPVMLAGGLTAENVGEAIETARPWAVDVSSGVETRGEKDHAKIRAFVAMAKGAVPA